MKDYAGERLFSEGAVKRFKNNGHEVMAFGAFDLLKRLNVILLRAVHDG